MPKTKKDSMKSLYDCPKAVEDVCNVECCDLSVDDNAQPCETCEILYELYGMASFRIVKYFQKRGISNKSIREFCNDSLEQYLIK